MGIIVVMMVLIATCLLLVSFCVIRLVSERWVWWVLVVLGLLWCKLGGFGVDCVCVDCLTVCAVI